MSTPKCYRRYISRKLFTDIANSFLLGYTFFMKKKVLAIKDKEIKKILKKEKGRDMREDFFTLLRRAAKAG